MTAPLWAWLATAGLIASLLVIDIKASARSWRPTVRRALVASAGWVAVSALFGLALWALGGGGAAEQYFTAYLLEKSLSVDNVFVFAVLFGLLGVPVVYQRRVLYYGVVGALAVRAGFIAAGAAVLHDLSWTFYLFGAVVAAAGVRMAFSGPAAGHGGRPIRAARRVLPVADGYAGERFVVRRAGRWLATPLLVALVAIEVTDVVFAVDSIPAVFGVTASPFIVFTSNAFAVMGLRSMYFLFAGVMPRLPYLRFGLAFVLVFIGAKMLLEPVLHVPTGATLAVMATAIAVSALVRPRPDGVAALSPPATRPEGEAA